jgi:hypothetical protein
LILNENLHILVPKYLKKKVKIDSSDRSLERERERGGRDGRRDRDNELKPKTC